MKVQHRAATHLGPFTQVCQRQDPNAGAKSLPVYYNKQRVKNHRGVPSL